MDQSSMMLDAFVPMNVIDFPLENEIYHEDILSNEELLDASDDPSSETVSYEQLDDYMDASLPVNTLLYDYEYLRDYQPLHQYITIDCGPELNQVKEFNILPTLSVHINYIAKSSDYIVARLQSDQYEIEEKDISVFMGAACAIGEKGDRLKVRFPNMKISKSALHGRTKGFSYYVVFTLVIEGNEVYSIRSNNFFVWSNVNQVGFPKEERKRNIKKRKEINTNRRKGKRKTFT